MAFLIINKILTTACVVFAVSHGYCQERKTIREGEPDIYNLDSDDTEMNEAVEKARATFNEFTAAFADKERSQAFFSVKVGYPTSDGTEHIWLSQISRKEDKFYGKVDNVPENIPGVQMGHVVAIDPGTISDWFYVFDGKLVGGYTIRVLRNRMTQSERKQFDNDFGVSFE